MPGTLKERFAVAATIREHLAEIPSGHLLTSERARCCAHAAPIAGIFRAIGHGVRSLEAPPAPAHDGLVPCALAVAAAHDLEALDVQLGPVAEWCVGLLQPLCEQVQLSMQHQIRWWVLPEIHLAGFRRSPGAAVVWQNGLFALSDTGVPVEGAAPIGAAPADITAILEIAAVLAEPTTPLADTLQAATAML